MKRTPFALAATVLLGACATAAAPPAAEGPPRVVDDSDRTRIDAALRRFVDTGQLAGTSALIYEDGEEVYFGAFGMADREAQRPMARDTIVQIYSMTKPITGVALMILYEEGRFQLDDPLAQYLPEFADLRVFAGLNANGEPIYQAPHRAVTIRDITRHTAGFMPDPDDTPPGRLLAELNPGRFENTLSQLGAALGQVPLAFHPGEKWRYGPSVDVQALLVERLSGMRFGDFVQTRIFDPLGMTETRYLVPPEDYGRWAAVYRRHADGSIARVPDEQIRRLNVQAWPLQPGSFGFTSTLDDYMRFARMLANGGALGGARILRPETVRLMATNHLDDAIADRSWLPSKGQGGFGIDFAVRTRPPASADEASGAVGEFFWDGAASTLFWVDPANDLAAVMFVQIMPFDPLRLHKVFRDAVYDGTPAAAPRAMTD